MDRFEAMPGMTAHLAVARKRLADEWPFPRAGTLAELRLRCGLSQAVLAARAGTSQSHIARIEQGKNDPTTEVISRLARALSAQEAVVFMAVLASRSPAE